MYRISNTLSRSAATALRPSASPISARAFAISSLLRANETGPATSQGHATSKAHETLHTDGDIQTASVRAGQDTKSKAQDGKKGSDEPYDAASQGSTGGSNKTSKAKKEAEKGVNSDGHEGAFQDQVGGQDEASPGVSMGKTEEVPGADMASTLKETAKNTVKAAGSGLGFDGLKQMRTEKKNFHTSARSFMPQSDSDAPSRDIPGSSQPVEQDSGKGEKNQNKHLKHKSAGKADSGKGNAAEEPHLPSKQQSSTSGTGKKGFHTSAVGRATGPPNGYARAHTPKNNEAGHDIPAEGGPKLDSPYGSDAIPAAQSGDIPSSQAEYSSTAVDPPNETLRAAAKDGSLGERNPQPQSEFGRIGLDDAWKERK